MEHEIRAAGGDVAKSVTKEVTILVASQPGTKKCLDAAKKGVMVVDEAWLHERLGTAAPPTKKGKATAEVMNAILYRRTTKTLRNNTPFH